MPFQQDQGTLLIYTASATPFKQGVNIKSPSDLGRHTMFKIRGNVAQKRTRRDVIQDQEFFDDALSSVNISSGSSKSLVAIDTKGRLGEAFNYTIDTRDLGQFDPLSDGTPFVESDPVEKNPSVILDKHPIDIVAPLSLVMLSAPSLMPFDGVIEPLDIRKIADLSSIELPYVVHSIKGDLCNTNPKRESLTISDNYTVSDKKTRPFLDSQQVFGNFDVPGPFSDEDKSIEPFVDSTDSERFYTDAINDGEITKQLVNGFTSSSINYRAPRVNGITSGTIYSGHGFEFSQNSNNTYDSIAFGGLVRGNRFTSG